MSSIKIIIVDDHKLFLDGLNFALSRIKNITIQAVFSEPKIALDYIKNNDVDLLISDISMPEMNGMEFIKKAKKIAPHIKTLVVSMFPCIHKIPGINGYLLKESEYQVLENAIFQEMIEGKSYFYTDYQKEITSPLEFNNTIITKREKEIIYLIAQEKRVEEIADILFLSKHTIEAHKKTYFLSYR